MGHLCPVSLTGRTSRLQTLTECPPVETISRKPLVLIASAGKGTLLGNQVSQLRVRGARPWAPRGLRRAVRKAVNVHREYRREDGYFSWLPTLPAQVATKMTALAGPGDHTSPQGLVTEPVPTWMHVSSRETWQIACFARTSEMEIRF